MLAGLCLLVFLIWGAEIIFNHQLYSICSDGSLLQLLRAKRASERSGISLISSCSPISVTADNWKKFYTVMLVGATIVSLCFIIYGLLVNTSVSARHVAGFTARRNIASGFSQVPLDVDAVNNCMAMG